MRAAKYGSQEKLSTIYHQSGERGESWGPGYCLEYYTIGVKYMVKFVIYSRYGRQGINGETHYHGHYYLPQVRYYPKKTKKQTVIFVFFQDQNSNL